MGAYGEYTDFKFGNTWASEYGLVAVSSGGRYKTPIYGDVNANTSTIPGKRGVYKWESQIGAKTFLINIAFDHLAIEDIDKIKKWLDPTKVDKLYFDNEPYKYYYACLAQDLDFSYVPFKEEEYKVGNNTFIHAVYKGEMTITFTAIDNYGYSDYDNFEQYDLKYIVSGNSSITYEDNDDNFILNADKIYNNLQYYTLTSGIIVNKDGEDSNSYIIKNNEGDPVYIYSDEQKMTKDNLQNMIDILRASGNELRYVKPNDVYILASEDLNADYNLNPIVDGNKKIYNYEAIEFNVHHILKDTSAGTIKPWVVGSGLLNSNSFYKDNNIFTSSLKPMELDDKIYLLNSGTADAVPIISFDYNLLTNNSKIEIIIKSAYLKANNNYYKDEDTQNMIIDFSNITDKKIQSFINSNGKDYVIEINCEICEVYLKKKNDESNKINITKLVKDNNYLVLKSCENVDYSKPFPTYSLGENSAITKTIFNELSANQKLNNFEIRWRHTYL